MWLKREIEYADHVVLPAGYRIPPAYDVEKNPERYDAWSLNGARSNAKRRQQLGPVICSIEGFLRVIARTWCTTTAPQHERPLFRRVGHAVSNSVSDACAGVGVSDWQSTAALPPSVPDVDAALEDDADGLADVDIGVGSEAPGVALAVDPAVPGDQVHASPSPVKSTGVAACGTVAVIDYRNMLDRAFYAGPVSKINGVRGMFETICNVLDRLCPEYVVVAFDGGHADRSALFPEYKAHRGPKPPELVEQIALGEQAFEALGWPGIRVMGWEADDVLASMATQFDKVALGVILITSDKDVLQVAGETSACVYQPWGEGLNFNNQRCLEKHKVPLRQMRDYLSLLGDSTDGIPGVPGIGEKTAAELLQQHGSLGAILAAAAAGTITGRAGKALKANADKARLSESLVRLNTSLPVGVHWQDWPIDNPREGWQQRLQSLGLGAVAQRLAKRLTGRPRQTSEPSIVEIRASYDAKPSPAEPVISEEMHANAAMARRIYDEAVDARLKHGKACCSGYHAGTLQLAAWDAGSRGELFESIDLSAFGRYGKPRAATSGESVTALVESPGDETMGPKTETTVIVSPPAALPAETIDRRQRELF